MTGESLPHYSPLRFLQHYLKVLPQNQRRGKALKVPRTQIYCGTCVKTGQKATRTAQALGKSVRSGLEQLHRLPTLTVPHCTICQVSSALPPCNVTSSHNRCPLGSLGTPFPSLPHASRPCTTVLYGNYFHVFLEASLPQAQCPVSDPQADNSSTKAFTHAFTQPGFLTESCRALLSRHTFASTFL